MISERDLARACKGGAALAPSLAAELLFQDGVGLLVASTDQGLASALCATLIKHRIKVGRAPSDFDATRDALRLLWGESEMQGRRGECSRYALPATRLQ